MLLKYQNHFTRIPLKILGKNRNCTKKYRIISEKQKKCHSDLYYLPMRSCDPGRGKRGEDSDNAHESRGIGTADTLGNMRRMQVITVLFCSKRKERVRFGFVRPF